MAHCQAQYNGGNINFNLNTAKDLAREAYEIFEKNLSKEDARTLNAYLILAHIITNLMCAKNVAKAENYSVKFIGEEPTIDAAIELAGFYPASEYFQSFKEKLSKGEKLSDSMGYLAIYTRLKDKIDLSEHKCIKEEL